MKYKTIAAAAIFASGTVLAGCGDSDRDSKQVEFTLDSANHRYEELEVRFDNMREDIEAQGGEVSEDMQRTLNELQLRLASVGDELEDAAQYTKDGWNEVQDEMAENLDDLERSLDRTWDDIRC